MTTGIEILEHTADVGFRATGGTWEEALDAAVRGLATIEAGGRLPMPTGERPVSFEAEDDESAVVGLLEECLYRVDAEGWLAVGAEVRCQGGRCEGLLRGAELPGEAALHVKAITWHGLSVERGPDATTISVILDI